jgi:flagellar motility protein MotE (MotC chaperone)
MKLLTQIFLASLIIVKIVLGSIFIYRVELGPFFLEGNAIAEEVQENPEGIAKPARHRPAQRDSGEAGGEGEDIADVQGAPEGAAKEGEGIIEEEKIDLNFLLKRKAELQKEGEDLSKKRAELMAIQDEINNKIAILTELRNEIVAEMAKKKIAEERSLRHLIKAYSAMKPQKAASLIEKLDITFAIELLSKMKGDAVGNILSFVDTDKAARISEQLAKRK